MKLPKLHFPVLTKSEKTAAAVLAAVLSCGAALHAWEYSGVTIGPVNDWDTLRKLVVESRLEAGGDTTFPCFVPPPLIAEEHWPQRAQDSVGKKEEAKVAASHSPSSSKKIPPEQPLDINVANVVALQKLPKVGPSLATAIVSYRAAHGKFRKVEDLMEVKGIGPKKFAAISRFISIGGI